MWKWGKGEGRDTLTQVWEFLLEFVGEAECYDGEAGVVICGCLVFFGEDFCGGAEEGVFSDWAVDVGDACIPIGQSSQFGFSRRFDGIPVFDSRGR